MTYNPQEQEHLVIIAKTTRLSELKNTYSSLYETEPEKAVDVIEQIYEISKKYDKLRMEKGL